MNRTSARIASRGFARQITALAAADQLAGSAERLVRRAWRQLLTTLRAAEGPHHAYAAARHATAVLARLDAELHALFAARLGKVAAWGHASAAELLARQVPRKLLASAAVSESRNSGIPELPNLLEAGFGLTPGVNDTIDTLLGKLPADSQRDLLRTLLFPPLSHREAFGLVYGGDWTARLSAQTKLAAPRKVAAAVRQGLVAGRSIEELAKDLLPVVDGVRATARRVAHDEVMWVSHQSQKRAWAEIDDLIESYTTHAVLDSRTRPAHRERNGRTCYKRPGAGQLGLDWLPDPPRASPAEGGAWEFGCRCFNTPNIRGAEPDPSAAGVLDPQLTGEWFDGATERERRTAVGTARYSAVKKNLGRKPGWADFTDAAGRLLDVEELAARG